MSLNKLSRFQLCLSCVGVLWGVVGVTAYLASAVVPLGKLAQEAFMGYELTLVQWVVAIVWLVFMLRAEGYRGFQKKFAPRVAARLRYLCEHPRPLFVLLAPIFCMGYFYGTKRRLILSYSVTVAIICLILVVRQLPQPWRGIIDLGVVAGLTWGIVSIWIFSCKALTSETFPYDPEIPESANLSNYTADNIASP